MSGLRTYEKLKGIATWHGHHQILV
jgi:hypothetical protein